jgi:hypothetical protein
MFFTPLVLTLGLGLANAVVQAQEQTTPALVQPQNPAAQQPDAAASANDPQDPGQKKADQKEPPTPEHTGLRALFGNLGEDIKNLPSRQNLYIASIGGGLAGLAHPWDVSFNTHLESHLDGVNTFFAPGKYIGNTPEQIAFSLGTYAYGRFFDAPKVAHLGMDLLQAQIIAEMMVEPLKFIVRRERPDGSNNLSFPSGHSAVTFATATVIERHLGWRKSVLAYVIASYVAMSRLHDDKHYLSDVIFGAAVGSIAGRTVVHHASDYWAFTPVSVPGGGVALLVTRMK